METTDVSKTAESTLRLRNTGVAAIAGAVAGSIIGPETSAIFDLEVGGLATVGAPFGAAAGILVGVAARGLLRQGTPPSVHAQHRASRATTSAAGFLIGGAVLSAVLWDVALREARELDAILVLALLPPIALLIISLVTLAVGVLRRRATARWAAVVVCVCACAAAFSRLLAELSIPLRSPDWAGYPFVPEWKSSVLQTGLLLAIPMAVTAFLLSPAARRDFSRSTGPGAA
ncbi:hypothetical protein GCM10023074_27420 [Microbispora amethystogenes]